MNLNQKNHLVAAFFACIIALAITGCEKDLPASIAPQYIVFGQFYGHCIGDKCVRLYKLDDNMVYVDNRKKYPNRAEIYRGSFVAMNKQAFDNTKDLMSAFPSKLLSEVDTVFGCPDCVDQGGLYIEYKSAEKHRFWIIDNARASVPSYLHSFMDLVDEKIRLLE